jgi:hypothetical protein
MIKKTVEADFSKGVSIRDPRAGEPFRCNPDPEARITAHVVRDPDRLGRYYVLARHLVPEVMAKCQSGTTFPAILHMCMNPEGEVFLWPVETEGDTAT